MGGSSWKDKVKHCGKLLIKWDKETFKRTQWRIAWLKRRLKKLRMRPQIVLEEGREVEKELRELRRSEETTAWQRCRPFILRDGDKNTAFFHAKAANRTKRNHLTMLLDNAGNPQTSFDGMKKVVCDFYKKLFFSSRAPISLGSIDMLETRLDDAIVAELSRPFVKEEVLLALKEMPPCKSPGPNGLPALFYKNHWNLVGEELCSLILSFLNEGRMPADMNHTFEV